MRINVSDELAASVAELHGGGRSVRSLAAEFNVPRSTISSILGRQPTLVQSATDEIEPIKVETTIPMITNEAASEFLNTIGATPVPPDAAADPAAETKRLADMTKLTDKIMGKPVFTPPRKRPLNMPKEVAEFDIDVETALNELGISLPAKAASKPRAAKRQPKQTADLSAILTEIPSPSKADLITQITLNVEAFEPLLTSIVQPDRETFLKSLYKKNEADLSVVLGVMAKTRTLANATNQLRHTFYLAAQGAEVFTSRLLSMKTEGFAQSLRAQDEEVRMIMKEIAMDKLDSLQKLHRPELRLAMLFSTTLLATDSANRIKDASRKQMEVKVSPSTLEKHNDL
jgi:hypothetical protein